MKLPTAKFPAQLREMKLVSMKPVRRLSYALRRRLKKNAAASPNTAAPKTKGANLFQASPSKDDVLDSKGIKLLLNLLLVRPWVLVLGFWLLSMGVGTLALNGMLSPRKLRMAMPEPAVQAQDTRSSLLNVEQAAGEDANDVGTEGEVIALDSGAASEGSNFPFLPIAALVGSCAVGSLVISRRRAMVRLAAARAKSRVRKSRPVSRPANSVAVHPTVHSKVRSAPGSLKSSVRSTSAKGRKGNAGEFSFKAASEKSTAAVRILKPKKRRPRTKSVPATAQASGRNRVLASRTNAQKNVPSGRPQTRVVRAQPGRVASKQRGRRQPIVSVVPAHESHALDWPNSSLAHQLDVRQQRSAM